MERPNQHHRSSATRLLSAALVALSLLAGLLVFAPGATANQPPAFVTLPGGHEAGWVLLQDTKQWVSPSCRVELEAAGATFTVAPWSEFGSLPKAAADLRCEELVILVRGLPTNSPEPIFVTSTTSNRAGWVILNGTRQWLAPACRTQLEAVGLTFAVVPWRTIRTAPKTSRPQTCTALVLFGPNKGGGQTGECATFLTDERMVATELVYEHDWDIIIAGRFGPLFEQDLVQEFLSDHQTPDGANILDAWQAESQLDGDDGNVSSAASANSWSSEDQQQQAFVSLKTYNDPVFGSEPPGGDVRVRDAGSASTRSSAQYVAEFDAHRPCTLTFLGSLYQNAYSWDRDGGRVTARSHMAVETLVDGLWVRVAQARLPAYSADGDPVAVETNGEDIWVSVSEQTLTLTPGERYRIHVATSSGQSYFAEQSGTSYSTTWVEFNWRITDSTSGD